MEVDQMAKQTPMDTAQNGLMAASGKDYPPYLDRPKTPATSKDKTPEAAPMVDNPQINKWGFSIRYAPEQKEDVRRILEDCQIMRIVRRLKAIGIEAEITREG